MGLKTIFLITVTTSTMIMPGMPKMPAGMRIPGMGGPTRTLSMDLTSDKVADAKSTAECAVPEGLLLGPKVDLTIDLPQTSKGEEGPTTKDNTKPEKTKMVIKSYWGCAEAVPAGQPKVLDVDSMMANAKVFTPEMKKMMNAKVKAMDDGSHAYWPGETAKKLKDKSATPGGYELTTNYCGGTSITFGPEQDFLAAIDVVSPGKGGVDLEKAIKIEWKSVPNAKAYLLTAFSNTDEAMIMWTSSSDPQNSMIAMGQAISSAELAKYIEKGVLLPASATSCSIPAGIFKGSKSPMLMMTALGADKSQEKDGIKTDVVVRSNAMVMLTAGMGNMEADEDNTGDIKEPEKTEETTDGDTAGQADKTDEGSSDKGDTAKEKPKPNVDKVLDTIDRVKGVFRR